jgi:hypothetical protein
MWCGCDANSRRLTQLQLSTALRSYTHIPTAQIRATLTRFYMLTNMTLSPATPASRRSDHARRSSRSRRYRRPERTNRAEGPLSPTVLIYGSAIKTSAKSPEFNNMQFPNRRQTGGLTIASSGHSGTSAVADHSSQPWLFLAPNATLFAPIERGNITESAQMKPARIE